MLFIKFNSNMSAKKHSGYPHLPGEHQLGDLGQLILLLLFLGVWITDSFIFHYSTFLRQHISDFIRIPLSALVLIAGWYLARNGVRAVFVKGKSTPELIRTGVYRIVRHPIYSGTILFYLGATLITMSLAAAACWILIVVYYVLISRYEERILTGTFGEAYISYQKEVGMMFPKCRRSGSYPGSYINDRGSKRGTDPKDRENSVR